MTDFFDKVKKTIEQSLDRAKVNAQGLKDTAEELGKVARLKFDLHQLNSSKRKKLQLLGETVYPFFNENKVEKLKTHESLPVLIDEIKDLNNQIELTQKNIDEVQLQSKEEDKPVNQEDLRDQINELESEIEARIEELKIVKESLNKKK
ncbi:MAG: hypothetical protein P8Y99_01705 [Calditrichaceae bacterium]|jgi:hypothetical protein